MAVQHMGKPATIPEIKRDPEGPRSNPAALAPYKKQTSSAERQEVTAMAQSKPPKSTVTVVYNGQPREVEFKPNQKLRILFAAALAEFGIPSGEGLGLFTETGAQLDLDVKAEDAGVTAGGQLVLRPIRVGGGS